MMNTASSALLRRSLRATCSRQFTLARNTEINTVRWSQTSTTAQQRLAVSRRWYSNSSRCLLSAQDNYDPLIKEYQYWNREEYAKRQGEFNYLISISPHSIVRQANILSLSDPNDGANESLTTSLPTSSKMLKIGTTLEDFADFRNAENDAPNVLYVSPSCPKARLVLPSLLEAFPSIEWVHVRSAGIDFVVSDELSALVEKRGESLRMTNAKGQFSSTLAEYTMMACSYFAKDLPRLMRQKKKKNWEKYDVEELRGKTIGIVGYGDIGRACAKLAQVYGMTILALRRNPQKSESDPYCSVIYGVDKSSLNKLMSESDYVVCSAPSTIDTQRLVDAEAFSCIKKNAVFINLGRGPVVDEDAMITALKEGGRLKGAALDVFTEEPLPPDNELWDLDNVLISPHNMDQTSTFMHEAADFFTFENLPRFICGKELLNPVDATAGY